MIDEIMIDKNITIGSSKPVFIIAEMSANHNHDFNQAVRIIHAAKKAGADAVKVQTYTPDTMTINSDKKYFKIKGTIWDGGNLYDLYNQAYTPWEWQPELKKIANNLGMLFFSSPFDATAVDFLESIDVPVFKIASFELIDIPLIKKVARTGKAIIISTGMASLGEIDEAVKTIKNEGNNKIVLLKCTSAYPALPEEVNLKTITHLSETFGFPSGLSDHTMGSAVAIAATALGACVIEKHFTLSRKEPGPDSSFSMEPEEFASMVRDIRIVEKSIGRVCYDLTDKQKESVIFRRSLFAVDEIQVGDNFTAENIRSIRPGHGMHTRHYDSLIGKKAIKAITKGTPLSWDMVGV